MKGADPKEIVEGAYEGAINVVEQAIKMGVKKIVYTSTFGTLLDRMFFFLPSLTDNRCVNLSRIDCTVRQRDYRARFLGDSHPNR